MSEFLPDAGSMYPFPLHRISVVQTALTIEKEPLIRPFGFKGGAMSEIWQIGAGLIAEISCPISSGENLVLEKVVGLGTQNVLWSDAAVFAAHSEQKANELMSATTQFALQLLNGETFETPFEIWDRHFETILDYAKTLTGYSSLRTTFVLNALVPVDNALWTFFFRANGLKTFDDLIPTIFRPAFAFHHSEVAAIPLIAYNIPVDEIQKTVDDGYFFMKIKIGQSGTPSEMLEKDKKRLAEVHRTLASISTGRTANGKLPYYFDANGRYDSPETLLRLLDYAEKIGALDQIVLIEEPFDEQAPFDVSNIPVRLAADESAHTEKDVIERIERGYRAIALKPAAKTLSMTMKMAQAAFERNVPCFCADLTVQPILVDWNKNIAARLSPFPGLSSGLLESNGHQNYRNWREMMEQHPSFGKNWTLSQFGVYSTDAEFYRESGGIFLDSPHWLSSVFQDS